MLSDVPGARPVVDSTVAFRGKVWDVVSDRVDLGDAGSDAATSEVVQRDYVFHTGAVAIMALNPAGEVYLVRQYRHPVAAETWEPPAGLTDAAGESPLASAQRELYEEADLYAAQWDTLVDFMTSPGGSSEGIRIFVARDLSEVPPEVRHVREHEERDMEGRWVALADILSAIWAGTVGSPTLVTGALALDAARRADWATLRDAHALWRKPPSLIREAPASA